MLDLTSCSTMLDCSWYSCFCTAACGMLGVVAQEQCCVLVTFSSYWSSCADRGAVLWSKTVESWKESELGSQGQKHECMNFEYKCIKRTCESATKLIVFLGNTWLKIMKWSTHRNHEKASCLQTITPASFSSSGSSSFHRSPQAEGVPAPHHLPEEPPQVRPDRGRGEEDLHAEVHQDRRQGPHWCHLPCWIHGWVLETSPQFRSAEGFKMFQLH